MPAVVAHGWAALASLVVLLATALSLAGAYVGLPLLERATALALHVAFAAYGFMGMLALGLSYILVPMFALSAAPDERAHLLCALAWLALLLAAAAAFGIAPQGCASPRSRGRRRVAMHLRLMAGALATGMRRELGRSFPLVRIAWGCSRRAWRPRSASCWTRRSTAWPTLFGLLLIGGWLLTFLLGILQRIVPFLASMHAARRQARRRPRRRR